MRGSKGLPNEKGDREMFVATLTPRLSGDSGQSTLVRMEIY